MKLSVDERRRILALQAYEIAEHYKSEEQSTEREQLAAVIEYPT